MEAGEGSSQKRQVYTPHLKKVLKSYQAAATTSLHGPNSVMGVWSGPEATAVSPPDPTYAVTTDVTVTKSKPSCTVTSSSSGLVKSSTSNTPAEYDLFVAPPPFPIQQPPIFTPADQGRCERTETVLESQTISCFSVGGEERLCLPQILNYVLRDFSLNQIYSVCDNLHIFCSRCNSEQLEILKALSILPPTAPSCGLITKTDAERLCAALLDSKLPRLVPGMKRPFQVRVYHECFGTCTGLYAPEMYVDPHAPCIECTECLGLLCPQKFVCHAHSPKENRTCHWGFDSFNWRAYILLDDELEDNIQLKEILKDMKSRFDFNHKYKRKQILSESYDPSNKRVRAEDWFPYSYTYDPNLVYWYTNPLWNKTTAFKPLPPVITKDGKSYYIPHEALPSLFKDRLETQYQHNLALTPANVQKLGLMKLPEETFAAYRSKKVESAKKRSSLKKESDYESNPCFDSEDAFSDTSFSTLSAGTEDGLVSNLDEDEEMPSVENELQELKKIMTDVEDSLSTKILSEVESLIAKYRKCLSNAIQGKKMYQMELDKVHYTQRVKIHKLRETNKHLEETIRKFQGSPLAVVNVASEHSENSNPKMTIDHPSPQSQNIIKDEISVVTSCESSFQIAESDCIDVATTTAITTTEEHKTVLMCSPTLPKQPHETEPLGK